MTVDQWVAAHERRFGRMRQDWTEDHISACFHAVTGTGEDDREEIFAFLCEIRERIGLGHLVDADTGLWCDGHLWNITDGICYRPEIARLKTSMPIEAERVH